MQKEIGSNFWFSSVLLNQNPGTIDKSSFWLRGDDVVWLSAARLAIKLVLETIDVTRPVHNKTVLLPSYTCWTVIEPFLASGYRIVIYSIDRNMRCNEEEIMHLIAKNSPSVFIFHDYFGFPSVSININLLNRIKNNGIIIIEDRTQTIYSDSFSVNADYSIGSLRKWSSVPDGAYAVSYNGEFYKQPCEYDKSLEKVKTKASILKHEYMTNDSGDKDTFLHLFRYAEELVNAQDRLYAISPNSIVLQSQLDINHLKKMRRDNFECLLGKLSGTKGITILFESLPKGVVPLYFPILCQDRTLVQQKLAQHNIYAPVIWPKPDFFEGLILTEGTEYLYKHLLCLPIDQRYDISDMERIVYTLKLIAQNEYEFGWMSWDEVKKYREQLIDMERSLMIDFHYPNWVISRDFVAQKIADLETHLKNGNTFFGGIRTKTELLGYYWGYTTIFIDKKRWNLRSIYFDDSLRGVGIGTLSMMEAEIKARELGCDQIATNYAVFNTSMKRCLEKNGFSPCRVEMIKDLDKDHE